MDRREMIAAIGCFGASTLTAQAAVAPKSDGVRPTVFDPRVFGAVGNGRAKDTPAIQRAIDACTAAGGGIVYLAPGTYLCGTVVLKSNVTLYLEAGATILGSGDIADYKQLHLIFASNAQNVGLAGTGKIDGNGPAFWVRTNRPQVSEDLAWFDAIHLDWTHTPKHPSPMVEFEGCTDVHISDVLLTNAPGWTLRPFNCERVQIRGIVIKNPVYSPNSDGIDPTCCTDVVISDCIIDTGDDAICLKSESLDGAPVRPSKNITVTNCVLSGCCNGFKFGTPTFGGFENITFSNSVIYNDDVPLSSRSIAGIQLSAVDGGWVDGVVISGIQMRRVRAPICLRRGTRHTDNVTPQNGMRGVVIEGLHATDAILTSSITGLPGMHIEDVRLSDIRIATTMPGKPEWVSKPVPEVAPDYPQSRMFGWLPASGLYVRHVHGLSMRDVSFSAPADEWRPTMVFDDVQNLRIDGLQSTSALHGEPMLQMDDVTGAWVSDAKAPQGARALLKSKSSKDLLVTGCDLRGAAAVAEGDASAVHSEYNVMKKA
ncbi:Polygalacturonase [Granulicella rosea]|uniref:Polygalacturonase n=1 Tax=Granulicella rosea TaxID=474952 RepID=A0A239MJ33_9BACT|nr:glycosyl hydrolase family 28 protein [Granulicella rosea]SNT42716.1 Polygalacturonase [Granulicella rosea]